MQKKSHGGILIGKTVRYADLAELTRLILTLCWQFCCVGACDIVHCVAKRVYHPTFNYNNNLTVVVRLQ